MRRNLAVAGGRQVKNEDFTQYIQAFTLLEGLFIALSHGDFIFTGVQFTPNGPNFDISAGIIFFDGELCIFDGATNVALPYKLTKNRVGVNPREFQDTVTRNTAEDVKLQFDAVGPFDLTQDTPRATDKFLRTANGFLRAPMDGNDNGYSNLWKSLLSDSAEMLRRIPKPTGANRYLKLGEFPINETQLSHLIVTGLEPNNGAMAHLKIKRTNLTPTDDAVGVITYVSGESSNASERPIYYLKRNDGTSKYELWVKSPASIPSGDLTSGVIRLLAEDFTDIEDSFVFETDFLWTASVPTGIVAFSQEFLAKSSDLGWTAKIQSDGTIFKQKGLISGDLTVVKAGTGLYQVKSTTLDLSNYAVSVAITTVNYIIGSSAFFIRTQNYELLGEYIVSIQTLNNSIAAVDAAFDITLTPVV